MARMSVDERLMLLGGIQRQLEGAVEDVGAALDLVEGLDEEYDGSDMSALLRHMQSAVLSLSGVDVDALALDADLQESGEKEEEEEGEEEA